jgi:hypothetical protein
MVLAVYTFWDVMWSMLVFFLWVLWFWLLFAVFGDIFRRRDLSGWGKTGWLVFTIFLPYLGVFVYLVSQNDGMTQRNEERARNSMMAFDESQRGAAPQGGAAGEIARAKQLLDSGAITEAEYTALKQKALAV